MVISLCAKGLTTGEVSAHLAEVYGTEVSNRCRCSYRSPPDNVTRTPSMGYQLALKMSDSSFGPSSATRWLYASRRP